MGEMASTIIGGLIAAASGALAILVTYWLRRKTELATIGREALVEWVSAYEEWVSLYNDYSGLVLGMPSPPDDIWRSKYLERLKMADEAGRRLDVAKYRVLVVEHRDWVRAEVARLTKQSEVRFHTSSKDLKIAAIAFRGAADGLRVDLETFLKRLAGASNG